MNLVLDEISDADITWSQFKVQKELEGGNYKCVKLVGDLVLDRQMILLGHIIRRDQDNFMKQVSFDDNIDKKQQLYKRSGAPRLNWIDDNIQRAHHLIRTDNSEFDRRNEQHKKNIIAAAKADVF